jgi:N-acetyl sugar amidotransferase
MQYIEKNEYEKQTGPFDTKYGLPEEVKFCTKCVISNQRPNSAVEFHHTEASKKATIHFDEHGVCDACRYAEKKAIISWDDREKELLELCNRHRSKDGSYDCLLPGSGGKDSFYAAHILKYKFKMNPLTVTWAPHIYTDWGWRNFQKWIHSGFDNYLCTPNGRTHRLLTRLAVENLFHPFQAFMIGQKAFAPKMALKFNIPLIFYGENEAEYGNPIQSTLTSKRDISYFSAMDQKEVCISGVPIFELEKKYKVTKNDLRQYMPPHPDELTKHEIDVHYLGYYLKWHPQNCYYYAVENGGFEASPERTPGTYSKYNSIDDKIDDLHYYTTFIKFGIGRATYDASQEIRSNDITREEGISLCKRFDGEFPNRFIDELFEYLSIDERSYPGLSTVFEQPLMTMDYFFELADRFRSPHLWHYKNGDWELRHKVWDPQWAGDSSQEEEAVNWTGNRY